MMAQANIKENRKHYIEYFLPFFLLLAPYKFGPIAANTIGLIIVATLIMIENTWILEFEKVSKAFLCFLGYVIVRDILRAILGSDSFQTQMNRMIEYVVSYLLIFIVCSGDFDETRLYKVWKIAGLIFSLGLLFHVIQIYVLGFRVINPISIIPGYKLSKVAGITTTRPSSFFPEPAAFVSAMLPLEFMALRRRDIRTSIWTTLAILASTSTVGVILSLVLWVTTFLQRDLKKQTKIVMIVVTIAIIYIFANIDIFDNALAKFILVTEGGSTFGSRVIGSVEIVNAMNWIEKTVGTNYNEVRGFIETHSSAFSSRSIVQLYWNGGKGNVFLNTFGQLSFKYGLIGFFLYVAPIFRCLKDKSYKAKPFLITILFAVFGQSMLLNSYYYMNIMIVILYNKISLDDLDYPHSTVLKDKEYV